MATKLISTSKQRSKDHHAQTSPESLDQPSNTTLRLQSDGDFEPGSDLLSSATDLRQANKKNTPIKVLPTGSIVPSGHSDPDYIQRPSMGPTNQRLFDPNRDTTSGLHKMDIRSIRVRNSYDGTKQSQQPGTSHNAPPSIIGNLSHRESSTTDLDL